MGVNSSTLSTQWAAVIIRLGPIKKPVQLPGAGSSRNGSSSHRGFLVYLLLVSIFFVRLEPMSVISSLSGSSCLALLDDINITTALAICCMVVSG